MTENHWDPERDFFDWTFKLYNGREPTDAERQEFLQSVVTAAEGVAPNGDTWRMLYRPQSPGGRHFTALEWNGGTNSGGAVGMDDIPRLTEMLYSAELKEGVGKYYLHGLVTSRIEKVRAECRDQHDSSEIETAHLPAATTTDGSPLRSFVIVRPPVDNVSALVGLDQDGQVVQRIELLGPFE